jgi:hypothetical protein
VPKPEKTAASSPAAPAETPGPVETTQSAPAETPVPVETTEPATAETTQSAQAATPTPTPDSQAAATPATDVPASEPAASPDKPETPTVVPVKVVPDVAVVYANGKKQAVALGQYFKAGDIWFQLLAVGPKTMKISVVDGAFAGGKNAITIPVSDRVTLVNTATGVEYKLRFTQATNGIPTTSVTDPTAATAAPATTTAVEATTPATTTTTESTPATPSGTTTTSTGS